VDYGTDLKLKKGYGGGEHKAGKDKPRPGAATGQGMGMGGYDAGRVNKAMGEIKGGGGHATYYCGGSKRG
jgi:hypothetical protein